MSTPPTVLAAWPELKAPGSALARFVLRCFGWRLQFDGLPARQGVILVYPHTSNWDFPLGILGKAGLGLDLKWWGKDSLFRIPVFGAWARWAGGIPVNRSHAQGMVGNTVQRAQAAAQQGDWFWLAAAPEGTRSLATGWRSGAYQVAVRAQLPIGLCAFDFATRTVRLTQFILPTGNPEEDMRCFAQGFAGVQGYRPERASPIQLKR